MTRHRSKKPYGGAKSPLRAATLAAALLGAPVIAGAGCATVFTSAEGVASLSSVEVERRAASLRKRLERRPKDRVVNRDLGHLLWLHTGNTDAALPFLEAAAQAGDSVSRASLVMIYRGRLHHEDARRHALAFLDSVLDEERPPLDEVDIEVTEFILRDFLSRIGDRPSLDADLLPRLDAVRLAVHHPSLAVLASLGTSRIQQRTQGSAPVDPATRGCVRDWQVSALQGLLGAADLMRYGPQDPFEPVDPSFVIVGQRCGVQVWNPSPTGSIRKMRTTVRNAAADIYFELTATDEYRLYVDGLLVARNDLTDRWPRNDTHTWLRLPPGSHTVELHLAVPRDKASWMLNMFDGEGSPVAVDASPSVRPDIPSTGVQFAVESDPDMILDQRFDAAIYSPWLATMELSRRLGSGDYDRAERLAHDLEGARFAEAALLLAEFERTEPSRGGSASSTRLERHLDRALNFDPKSASAQIKLLYNSLGRDEVPKVLDTVAKLTPSMRSLYATEVLLTELYFKGTAIPKRPNHSRAKLLAPDSCFVRRGELTLARRRAQSHLEDELIATYGPCDRNNGRRASWARRRGDYRAALEITDRTLESRPDDFQLLDRKAMDHIALGELQEALEVRRRQLRYAPLSVSLTTAFVDLAFQLGLQRRLDVW